MVLRYSLVDSLSEWQWWMPLADDHLWTQGEVQNEENKPLRLVQNFVALLALLLKSSIRI